MKGEFKILIGNKISKYTDFYDIPNNFDNLISFKPDFPKSPHTDNDHQLIETIKDLFRELLLRER